MVLAGAWAGIVVFWGPTFGYSVDGSGSWHWSSAHTWLHLAPGAMAVLAGLLMLASLPRLVGERAGRGSGLASIMSIVAGAWLVIGPASWPTLVNHAHPVWAATTPLRTLADQVGANLGPGLILMLAGSLTLGLVSRYRTDEFIVANSYRGEHRVAA
jgi:hypothetical protein